MSKITVGKVLLTVTALYAGAGPYVFDWNKTHIHNPDWPPHAKFHNAQTMSIGAALSAAALTAIWGRGRWSKGRLQVAVGAASMYWATQLSAAAYPGVAMMDPPARTSRSGPQTYVAAGALAINILAVFLERGHTRR
ncbi:MAG TPA: DUF6640 family protein [Cellulomonas sp.]